MDEKIKKLNIGCGRFKKQGFINLDIDPRTQPEVIHDLDKFPYPFDNDSFDLVEANHILEHLNNSFLVMKEIWRILKPGGKLIIRVPHFSRGFTHPEHKRGFDLSFPFYFNPDFKGGYCGVSFALEKQTFNWFAQLYLKKATLPAKFYYPAFVLGKIINFFANLSPFFCSRIWCYWVGGFEEIEFVFVKRL